MRASSLLADVAPLRESPHYLRLWTGSTVSAFGSAMSTFAVALQVYRLTGSSAAVGGIGLAAGVPAIVAGILGGRLIDTADRRRIVLATSTLLALTALGFVVQAYARTDSLALLYLLVAVEAALGAVNAPARRTFAPRLLPPERVPAAAALTTLSSHASTVLGPLVAGVSTSAGGLRTCYVVDAATFAVSLYGVARLPPMRPAGGGERPSVAEGFRFLRRNRVLAGALLADADATILAMPVALFPAINAERFGGSATSLGLLSAGLAAGGVVGSVLSGPVGRVARPGRAMVLAGTAWGAALAAFGLVDGLAASVALLAVAGVADVCAVIWRTSIVQLATPDSYRGRASAAEHVVGVGGPQLGNVRAGLIASWTTPDVSALTGGLSCVAGAGLLALAFPALLAWRARSP